MEHDEPSQWDPLGRVSMGKYEKVIIFLSLSLSRNGSDGWNTLKTRSDQPILKWRTGSGNRVPDAETAARKRKLRRGRENWVKTIVL